MFSFEFLPAKPCDNNNWTFSYPLAEKITELLLLPLESNHDHTTNVIELKAKFDEIINFFRKSVFHGKIFLNRKTLFALFLRK